MYKITEDKNGKLTLSCDVAGYLEISNAINVLNALEEQIEKFGAMEISGEIGQSSWHLQNLLDDAQPSTHVTYDLHAIDTTAPYDIKQREGDMYIVDKMGG